MSYNVVTTEGIRTFENIDDAGDYAQAMSLRTGDKGRQYPLRRLRPDPTQRLPLRQGRDQEGARRSRG